MLSNDFSRNLEALVSKDKELFSDTEQEIEKIRNFIDYKDEAKNRRIAETKTKARQVHAAICDEMESLLSDFNKAVAVTDGQGIASDDFEKASRILERSGENITVNQLKKLFAQFTDDNETLTLLQAIALNSGADVVRVNLAFQKYSRPSGFSECLQNEIDAARKNNSPLMNYKELLNSLDVEKRQPKLKAFW